MEDYVVIKKNELHVCICVHLYEMMSKSFPLKT